MINRRGVSRPKNYVPKPRICPFCTEGINIDYKDVSRLSQYISGRGKIESRRRTRACAKHQRKLAQAVKRARFLALLPFAPSHIWKTGVDLRQPMS